MEATVVGLVGGIGAGKSTVAGLLAERGAQLFDADAVARDVLERPEVAEAVERDLGAPIRDEAGRVDARRLAARVFGDPPALRRLEARIHPEVRRRAEEAVGRARRGSGLLVLDVPLLLEAGFEDLCDLVVFVEAPREERLARARAARGWSAEEIERRERRQWPAARKAARAGYRLRNAGDRRALEREVDRLVARIAAGRVPRRPA